MLTKLLEDQFILLDRFVQEQPVEVVDVGAGLGDHCRRLLDRGVSVVAVDRVLTPSLRVVAAESSRCRLVEADATRLPMPDDSVPALWSSHCLEHVEDPLAALREWRRVLQPGGLLAVLVPPYKTEVVGRHVFTGWNAGQLMLTLLRARFRVRDGIFAQQGYNVFAVVRKSDDLPCFQPNDEILVQYHGCFPAPVEQEILAGAWVNSFGEKVGRFNGNIARLGW